MNGLDLFLIIISLIFIICGVIVFISGIKDDELEIGIIGLLTGLFVGGFIICIAFLVIDKSSGATIGTITSVDKNFYGTTALYIKTTENNEEQYCIEFDEELEAKAKLLIGKKVKISYGKRVGLYSTSKCHQSPIEKIEEVKD